MTDFSLPNLFKLSISSNKQKTPLNFIVVICSLMLFSTSDLVNATGFNIFQDRDKFEAALKNVQIETFNSFTDELDFRSQPLDIGPFSLSISGSGTLADRQIIDIPPAAYPEFEMNNTNIANVFTSSSVSLIFTFDVPVYGFGSDFAGFNNKQGTTIEVANTTLSPPKTSGVSFFGFTSDTAFTAITFKGSDNDGYGIDNVTFSNSPSAVPVPAAIWLMGTALLGLLGMRKKLTKPASH